MKKISALFLVFALLLSLTACGGGGKGDDPNVGMWNAVSASMLGFDMEVSELFESGVTLELKSNGRFTIQVDGKKGSGKWEYSGSGLHMTASGVDMTATIADGVLTLANLLDMGVDLTFEKEGGYSNSTTGAFAPAAGSEAGYYLIDSIVEDGETYDSSLLQELGIAYYILLNEDGSAEISTDSLIRGTWTPGRLRYQEDGEDVVSNYTLEKGLLTIELGGADMKLVFKRSDAAPPAQSPGGAPSADTLTGLQQWWNGDWYGFIYLSTADGVWKELEDGVWDCFGTIDSDAAGLGSIFLWDDGGELADVALQITEHGVSSAGVAMSQGGSFNAEEIGRADWIIDPGTNTQPYEHLIIIDGTFEDTRASDYGGFQYEIWLRPWGMLWDDVPKKEDLPPGYYKWYLDRYTASMPTMNEFMSGADAQSGAGSSADPGGSAQMTTVDFDSFTVGYPAGMVLEDDWINGQVIKDEGGKFEVQFYQQRSEEQVATVREEMAAYLKDPETKGATEFSRPIGGMSDMYSIKYDSVVWNEAMFSIAYPQPINGYAGLQVRIKVRDTKHKIDDVLALPEVQAILDSIVFKSGV